MFNITLGANRIILAIDRHSNNFWPQFANRDMPYTKYYPYYIRITMNVIKIKELHDMPEKSLIPPIKGFITAAPDVVRLWGLGLGIPFCYCWSYHSLQSILLTPSLAEDLAQVAEVLLKTSWETRQSTWIWPAQMSLSERASEVVKRHYL